MPAMVTCYTVKNKKLSAKAFVTHLCPVPLTCLVPASEKDNGWWYGAEHPWGHLQMHHKLPYSVSMKVPQPFLADGFDLSLSPKKLRTDDSWLLNILKEYSF